MKRVRVVQVRVVPVLVVDDGETLAPLEVEPVTVSAEDWPTYSTKAWPEAVAKLESQLNEPSG